MIHIKILMEDGIINQWDNQQKIRRDASIGGHTWHWFDLKPTRCSYHVMILLIDNTATWGLRNRIVNQAMCELKQEVSDTWILVSVMRDLKRSALTRTRTVFCRSYIHLHCPDTQEILNVVILMACLHCYCLCHHHQHKTINNAFENPMRHWCTYAHHHFHNHGPWKFMWFILWLVTCHKMKVKRIM